MSTSIYRIAYKSIPNVGGTEDANLIDELFSQDDNGNYFISKEALNAVNMKNYNKEAQATIKALKAAVKKYGDFDMRVI